MAAIPGAPAFTVRSGIMDSEIVLNPAASISRCTSPTDQQYTGQTGTSTTTSTCSARRPHDRRQALLQKPLRPKGVAHVRVVGRRRRAHLARSASSSSLSAGSPEFKSCSAKLGLVKVAHLNVAGPHRPWQHAIRGVGKPGVPLLDFRVKRVIGFQGDRR
jgi:hypothetical protein